MGYLISYKNIQTKIVLVALASLASLFLFASHAHAAPATFTVTNTNDSGAGSLRQAITDANSNANPADMDVINFNIAGSGVHTIALSSALPDVTEKVTIDGYSQTGAVANTAASPNPFNGTLKIEIQGNSGVQYSLKIAGGAEASIVKGLAMFDSDQDQLVAAANNVLVQGNYLGLRADGLTKGDNSTAQNGLYAESGNGVIVGGTSPEDRNIAVGYSSGSSGMSIGGTNTEIYGNYIGIAKDGVTDLGSVLGLGLGGSGAIAGGTTSAKANVISGSQTACVVFTGNNNTLQGNYIGTSASGTVDSSITSGTGVIFAAGASLNLVGGTNIGEGNIIKGISGTGVGVQQLTINAYGPLDLTSTKNAILGNSISQVGIFDYPGFGSSNQGIDLFKSVDSSDPADFIPDTFEQQGVTSNDVGDSDTGPNGYMNYPVIKSARQVGNQLTITYDLDASDSPSNTYRVEFFASDASSIFGQGPGETYLGATTPVSPGTNLTATLTVSGDQYKKALSATTTAIDGTTSSGFGSTGEFSRNVSVGNATDYDADGIADTVENQAPNNGDGNNDGTPDRLQSTVTSLEIDSTGIFETFVTTGCSENGTVSSLDESSFAKRDTGKNYPYGLTDFTLHCSFGDTVNVTKYVFVDDAPSVFVLRKYNPNSQTYRDVPGSSISSEQVGAVKALVARYSITDGGELDDDGSANGVIVDPVGLATTATLADTGTNVWVVALGAVTLLGVGLWVGQRGIETG